MSEQDATDAENGAVVYSTFGGVVGYSQGTIKLNRGQSVDEDHPLVSERPDLFTYIRPDASISARAGLPPVERATARPGEVRATPGKGPKSETAEGK